MSTVRRSYSCTTSPAGSDRVPQVREHRAGRRRGTAAAGHRRDRTVRPGSVRPPRGPPARTRTAVPGGLQHALRLAAEVGVDVDAADEARRPDTLGHEPHRLPRAAAGVQAARARRQAPRGRAAARSRPPRCGPAPAAARTPPACARGRSRRVRAVSPWRWSHRWSFRVGVAAAMLATAPPTRIVEATTNFSRALWRRGGNRRTVGTWRLCCSIATPSSRPSDDSCGTSAPARAVVVVEGPAGIGKSSLLRAAARTPATPRAIASCARAATRSTRTPAGASRASCSRRSIASGLDEYGQARRARAARARPAGAGAGARRRRCARRRPARVLSFGRPRAGAARGRRRGLGRRRFLRWLRARAARRAAARRAVRGAHREPPGARSCWPSCWRPSPTRRCGRGRSGPVAAERWSPTGCRTAGAGVRHACHAVTAGNPFLLRRPDGPSRGGAASRPTRPAAERLSAFGPAQVARTVERQLARLPDGAARARPRARRPRPRGAAAPRRPACAPGPRPCRPRAADALRAAGLARTGTPQVALAHPLIAGRPLQQPRPGRTRAVARRRRPHARRRARRPRARRLHLLRTEPTRDDATVAALRAAAAGATGARGAPESAVGFLRRALAEPPLDPATAAADAPRARPRARGARPARRPRAPPRCGRARRLARPARRARALGERARSGSPATSRRPCTSAAAGSSRRRERSRRGARAARGGARSSTRRSRPARSARAASVLRRRAGAIRPAGAVARQRRLAVRCSTAAPRPRRGALLAPALEEGRFDREVGSLLPTATYVLIASDDLDSAIAALRHADRPRSPARLADRARARSFMRAMALVQAGRIRDAETDARLGFEFKRAHSPAPP